jgi:glycosyltransferase involved in cell wall biosynthesis
MAALGECVPPRSAESSPMNVLITRQAYDDPGGISNYFNILEDRFHVGTTPVVVGRRVDEKGLWAMACRMMNDYVEFLRVIRKKSVDLVHLNISLNAKGVFRDGVFLLLSKALGKRTLVFFHGWDPDFERRLSGPFLWLFKRIYLKSDAFIVLAAGFEQKLRSWGVEKPVYLESTLVDDGLLRDFNIAEAIQKRLDRGIIKVLFLARLIKGKGIYETLDAVAALQKKDRDIHVIVAGDGDERESAERYVSLNGIKNARFTGYVTGERKRQLFEEAFLYCLPSYQEGLPTSLLEAMSFGLPIIASPVGGIPDIVENGKNGFLTDDKESATLAGLMGKVISDESLYRRISMNNHALAKERFMASGGVRRLEQIYEVLVSERPRLSK